MNRGAYGDSSDRLSTEVLSTEKPPLLCISIGGRSMSLEKGRNMAHLKKYTDIDEMIINIDASDESEEIKNKLILFLNELTALRNSHEVVSARSRLEHFEQVVFDKNGCEYNRVGIYDEEMTGIRDVSRALALGKVEADDFIIVDSDSVAAKFFKGDYNVKKPVKKDSTGAAYSSGSSQE